MSSVPLATYRLQLTKDFTFDDAARITPYLKQFGVTHVYASPFLKARAGSTHGYDIVDHNAFNPELGGEEGFARLSEALKANRLGLILDFVPNHMGVGLADNAWWLDVLEWGPKSPHATAFDIDWHALPHRRQPGVLLPILGKPYGEALEAGELTLRYDDERGEFAIWYFDHKLPVTPPRYGEILRQIVSTAGAMESETGRRVLQLVDAHDGPNNPSYRDAPAFKSALRSITNIAPIIADGLAAYDAKKAEGAAALHRLLERQNYRVAFWRMAFSAINYRRFFDVNDLAGVRMEHPPTFHAAHRLISQLIKDDQLLGLRLDHIDGLYDPMQYTRRLRQLARQLGKPQLYVTVEKILEEGEALPPFAGVAGTTGYEWLNAITHVLVDAEGLAPLDDTWRRFTGEHKTLHEMLDEAKSRVLETMLASEFTVLTERLSRIAAGHFASRDYTLDRLRAALKLYVLEFPVYRTYATAAGISDRDRDIVRATIARAQKRWGGPDPDIFDFLLSCLELRLADDPHYSASRIVSFAMKLQQFTVPLMAKALEDTAFYRHHRLLALNEVGGSPDAKPLTPAQFHQSMATRLRQQPHGLTATATHDTKRGEDTRMRILALSHIPQDWAGAVASWKQTNATLRNGRTPISAPSAAHEYMLYQALIGSWPFAGTDATFVERIVAYAMKAAREGKQQTSWTNPDTEYEKAFEDFIRAALDEGNRAFLNSFADFASRTSLLGALLSLSQLTLKAMQPGVPDFYQGTELWDFALVDPDNRRPVDFSARERLLNIDTSWKPLTDDWQSGAVKFALARRLMQVRAALPHVFHYGHHEPLAVTGAGDAEPYIAFSRTKGRDRVIVIASRAFRDITQGGRLWPSRESWQGSMTLLGSRRFIDLYGVEHNPGSTVTLSDLLQELPVAVLYTPTA